MLVIPPAKIIVQLLYHFILRDAAVCRVFNSFFQLLCRKLPLLRKGTDILGDKRAFTRYRINNSVMLEQLGAPNERADIEWPLARARWQANDDRPAAVALARAAREHYREAEQADNVAAIDAWLSDVAHAH